MDLPQARQGSERNAVVSTENDREELVASGTRHESGNPLRCVLDLRQEPGVLVSGGGRLRHGRLHVPEIHVVVAEVGDARRQPRIPNRGRPHVDPTTAGPQVEGGADDGHFVTKGLRRHGRQG